MTGNGIIDGQAMLRMVRDVFRHAVPGSVTVMTATSIATGNTTYRVNWTDHGGKHRHCHVLFSTARDIVKQGANADMETRAALSVPP